MVRRHLVSNSSSRRLSSIVNPDVLHDVTFHVTDEFSRSTQTRRHSIATALPGIRGIPSLKQRAASERLHISKADRNELLEGESDVPERDLILEDEEPSLSLSGRVSIPVLGLFFGYLLSSVALQKLNSLRPGCGQLVTLLQYLATIAEKSPQARKYVYSPVLPWYMHAAFVLLMFVSVQMGNASLKRGLPFGLFLVIKNTNLAWSLLLGLGAGKSFTAGQILSIAIVMAGITVCVFAQQGGDDVTSKEELQDGGGGLFVSSLLCTASTFCMAALGFFQQVVFARYNNGQEANESLFFTHLLGLPLFASELTAMRDDIAHLALTPQMSISMLALNIIFTLAVKQSFVQLLERGESVTASFTLAVARMTGVIISQLLESIGSSGGSPATLHFWMGALLVAIGSISYATGGRLSCKRS